MNLQLNRKNFLTAIKLASNAVSSKTTLPIQSCFLIETKDNILYITGSDNEMTIKTKCDVLSGAEPLSICVEAKELVDAINAITDEIIELDIYDTVYIIKYKKGSFQYPVQRSENYPIQKQSEYSETVKIDASKLSSMIQKTVSCTANDELRPVMNGVCVELYDDKFITIASDGHKLRAICSENVYPVSIEKTDNLFVLGTKPCINLVKILPLTESVNVKVGSSNVIFYSNDFVFTARLIEGRFPNWRSIVPHENPNNAIVDKKDFTDAIKRVSLTANVASSLLKCSFSGDLMGGKLTLSATDIDFNKSSSEDIECEYKGEPLEIGLKATFLSSLLSNMDSENTELQLSDPSRAVVIKETDNDGILSLLMPMMIP